MGRLIFPDLGPVYIDANAVIYQVEGIEPYSSALAPLWQAFRDRGLTIITSELTLLEVLVKPLKNNNQFLVELFRSILLDAEGLSCLSIDREILTLAARIRADWRLKTPDAIHAATALLAGATMFLTNDFNFRRITDLNVVLLDEVISLEPEAESESI